MTTYPAITIWQPWATLIAAECKPFEFRGWPAPAGVVGRRIAIHAGARPVKKEEIRDLLVKLQTPRYRETGLVREPSIILLESILTAPGILPRSSIMCIATLGKPIKNDELAEALGLARGEFPMNDSDRDNHSNFGWPLRAISRLTPPLPAVGAQGFWQWQAPDQFDTDGAPPMIIIRVELWSARTGKVTELARMMIENVRCDTDKIADYRGVTYVGRDTQALNQARVSKVGEVNRWRRNDFHVWNLVQRMLVSMGYTK